MTDNADLRAAAEVATPGPWILGGWGGQCHMEHRHGQGDCNYEPTTYEGGGVRTARVNEEVLGSDYDGMVASRDDLVYIALASPDRILGILSELERKTAALDNLLRHHNAGSLHQAGHDPTWCEFARQARAALEGKPTE